MSLLDRRLKYLETLKRNHKTALRITFLNPDETIQREITNEIYSISGTLNVNYQDGARRSCTITINNESNVFPIGWNGFWIGQKFQLWTGLYLDDEGKDPYYFSQGIFYITNPKEAYNPTTRTVTLQGADKWAGLDGKIFGFLNGTYKSSVNEQGTADLNIKEQVKGLLINNRFSNTLESTTDILKMVDLKEPIFEGFSEISYTNKYSNKGNVIYTQNSDPKILTDPYVITTKGNFKVDNSFQELTTTITTLPTTQTVYQAEVHTFTTPYSVVMELGKTFADIILEYKTMLMGKVFYDREGYLRFEPISTSASDYSDTNREIAWHFTVTEQELLGLELEYKFDNVFNDVIVLGAITNGRQAKARVQNRDAASETSIDRIGIKTKTPYQSDQYYSDEQCVALAKYYAQTDMAIEKSGTISSLPIYHLDVGQIVTVSTPNNKMSQEKFLVTGFSYNLNGTMSISVTNLRYFVDWTVVPIE